MLPVRLSRLTSWCLREVDLDILTNQLCSKAGHFLHDLLFCTVMLFLYVFINEFKIRQMELTFSTQLLYQVPRGY